MGSDGELGRRLLSLKEEIGKREKQIAEWTGERNALLKQLKKDFNVDSIDEAIELMEKKGTESEKRQVELREKLGALEQVLEGEA